MAAGFKCSDENARTLKPPKSFSRLLDVCVCFCVCTLRPHNDTARLHLHAAVIAFSWPVTLLRELLIFFLFSHLLKIPRLSQKRRGSELCRAEKPYMSISAASDWWRDLETQFLKWGMAGGVKEERGWVEDLTHSGDHNEAQTERKTAKFYSIIHCTPWCSLYSLYMHKLNCIMDLNIVQYSAVIWLQTWVILH